MHQGVKSTTRTLLLILTLVLAWTQSGTVSFAVESGGQAVVNFPDKTLEKAIRQVTGIHTRELRRQDVQQIQELAFDYETLNGTRFLADGPITNLEGLQHLTNLETLNLRYYHLVDSLKPLAGLTRLRSLDLSGNPVTDLSPLAGATGLRQLNLTETRVERLDPLRKLVQLEQLILIETPVRSLDPLGDLRNLRKLNLYFFAKRPDLNLDFLGKLSQLEELDVSGIESMRAAMLLQLPKLKRVVVQGIALPDYRTLGQLVGLEELYLDAPLPNPDLSFLTPLINLRFLSLYNSNIEDIRQLSGLTKLERLHLPSNKVRDLRPLQSLEQLTELALYDNGVEDLRPLASLTKMKRLHLSLNRVKDLTPLAGMNELEDLQLDRNYLSSLRGIEDLANLREVNVMWQVVQVDSDPAIAALRDRILAAGGKFEYQRYSPLPDIALYLNTPLLYANGEYKDTETSAFVEGGRTMVPIRFISEQLGAKVDWQAANQTVLVQGNGKQMRLQLGSNTVTVNGVAVKLDTRPINIKGVVFVPLRFLSEQLNLQVDYYQFAGSVGLTKKG